MPDIDRAAPDLAACAAEPIHVPGAIQPHGALLLVDLKDGGILQASANAGAFPGMPAGTGVGGQLAALLDPADLQPVLAALRDGARECEASVRGAGGVPLAVTGHMAGGHAILEFEHAVPSAGFAVELDAALRAMAAAPEIGTLVATCARSVRELSGFDRVMVYRFDEDDHGEVVAEDRDAAMEPYLGHHYPESDIPRQARALYLRNWIRCIPDAGYRPVPLVPALRPDTGAPLDLSGSHLRSVSPVHLEYLANMGVSASMSVSLIVQGRLWGLISCGHRAPRPMPPVLRRACETIGRLVSLQLAALTATAFQRHLDASAPTLAALRAAMREEPARLLQALLACAPQLMSLVGASGAAVVEGGNVVRVGTCPSEEEVRELAALAREQADEGLFSTRQLPRDVPARAALAPHASGLMGWVLPGDRVLLWFRPQVPHTIVWGADPAKTARVEVENGTPRIHPRRSFQLWEEEIRGKSLPWEPAQRHLAAELRRHALEIDLAYQVEQHKAAVRARDDLVAVVSHDLRTPVSVVLMQATLIQRFLAGQTLEHSQRLSVSARTIQSAADRMHALLRDLLDLSRIEAGRFQVQPVERDAGELVREACELMRHMAETGQLRLVEQAPDPGSMHVLADAERVFHVLANLIGNAIKFTPAGGTITVGAESRCGRCVFSVRDTGRGMSLQQLAHVFERYWQAREADHATGSGLGLYICKGIVEAHGGRIWAQSEVGQGSTFCFELPCTGAAAPAVP
jgi:light-regulated signal transduction histidine kinase (bacteriophytochrome)